MTMTPPENSIETTIGILPPLPVFDIKRMGKNDTIVNDDAAGRRRRDDQRDSPFAPRTRPRAPGDRQRTTTTMPETTSRRRTGLSLSTPSTTETIRCRNVEECQELAEREEARRRDRRRRVDVGIGILPPLRKDERDPPAAPRDERDSPAAAACR